MTTQLTFRSSYTSFTHRLWKTSHTTVLHGLTLLQVTISFQLSLGFIIACTTIYWIEWLRGTILVTRQMVSTQRSLAQKARLGFPLIRTSKPITNKPTINKFILCGLNSGKLLLISFHKHSKWTNLVAYKSFKQRVHPQLEVCAQSSVQPMVL